MAIKVLIVEDDEPIAAMAKKMFVEFFDHHVSAISVAKTFAEFEILITDERYNIVLLDLNLPDSRERTTIDRALPFKDFADIIIFTGLSDPEVEQYARDKGLAGFICKDGELFQELQLIKRVIQTLKGWDKGQDSTRRNIELMTALVQQKLASAKENARRV